MSRCLAAFFAISHLLVPITVHGQVADPNAQYPRSVREFDPATDQVKDALPFDEPFLLKVPVPEGVDSIRVDLGTPLFLPAGIRALDPDDSAFVRTKAVEDGILEPPALTFLIPPLAPRENYDFKITYYGQRGIGMLAKVPSSVERRITGRTATSFTSHFVTDIGMIYAFEPGYWGAATTLHAFLAPINKKAPVSFTGLSDFRKSTSAFVGLTSVEIASEADVDKLYGIGSPIMGLSVRLTRSVHVGAGVMFFEQTNANPLIDDKVGKRGSFMMLTVDLDYKSILGPLAALLGA